MGSGSHLIKIHGNPRFTGLDTRIRNKAENRACLNLDALSVPEALVQSIRILVAPAVVLVLERQLVPPGFECCEREFLGRSWRRDWGMCICQHF